MRARSSARSTGGQGPGGASSSRNADVAALSGAEPPNPRGSGVVRAWAVIPARLGSTRLPRKVLADLHGRTMLEHVWRRVRAARGFERVLVATDDAEILDAARGFGADPVVAGPARNGTERVALAVGDAA